MKKQCALFLALFLACGNPFWSGSESIGFTAVAQTGKVSGVVKDSNGEPLIGASVLVKGTNNGVSTDIDGRFQINAAQNATLVVSYVGYKTREIKAAHAKSIVLEDAAAKLDEVVVTAEFGLKRVARSMGSSAQNVKASDIQESGRTDFITALQGRVSGMQVTSTTGAPGASTNVVLRSVTSISGSNQPLYVIDGVPMNNSTFSGTSGFAIADAASVSTMDFSSRGNDFNPEDIESMTVLKGAAAAALYGSDASNGAIIITTKKGSKGRAKLSYSNQFSWSKAYGWPEIQDKYLNGQYGATNWYYTDRYGGLNVGGIKHYDNVEAVLQTGFSQRHNVSLEAGDEKKSVRASYSYSDTEGVVKTTDYKRQNISVSGRAEISKYVTFEGSLQYAKAENDKVGLGTSGPVYRAYTWPAVDDMSQYMAEDNVHMKYPSYYTDGDMLNPLFGMYKNLNHDESDHFISAMTVRVTPYKNTYVNANFGWDVSTSTYEVGTHPFYRSYNQDYPTVADKGGSYHIAKNNLNDITMNIIAGWDETFNDKYSVGLQFGYHQYEKGTTRLSSSGSDFQVVDFMSINNCTASTITSKKTDTKRRLQAISGQASFGYNNMAFATLRFRNDWSSTLPKEDNSFFYPAAELSFVASELTPVRSNLPWLNYLKLRGSVAQVGKDASPLAIDPELETTGLTGGGYQYGFTGPNHNLKPEMNTSWEVGAEFRMFNNRLDGDFTYFNTKCEDQIVEGFRMSYATGFVLNNLNVGSFKTWGWEAGLRYDVIKTRDLTWNVGVTASHTGSEVTYLPEGVDEYYNAYTWVMGNSRNGIKVGYPITSMTSYDFERNKDGVVLISPTSGLPILDTNEWVYAGDREPNIRYGITTSVQYKDFRLSAVFSGVMDATIANATEYDMMRRGYSWESVEQRESGSKIFHGVLKDGFENSANPNYSTIAYNPRTATSYVGNGMMADWIEDGIHYVRCQEIRLNYNIPSEFLSKWSNGLISRANVFVAGNDLFTITNYSGVNPVGNSMSAAAGGSGGMGIDNWGLPSPRTYTCGLSVTF